MGNNERTPISVELEGPPQNYSVRIGELVTKKNNTPEEYAAALLQFHKEIKNDSDAAYILVSSSLNPDAVEDTAYFQALIQHKISLGAIKCNVGLQGTEWLSGGLFDFFFAVIALNLRDKANVINTPVPRRRFMKLIAGGLFFSTIGLTTAVNSLGVAPQEELYDVQQVTKSILEIANYFGNSNVHVLIADESARFFTTEEIMQELKNPSKELQTKSYGAKIDDSLIYGPHKIEYPLSR